MDTDVIVATPTRVLVVDDHQTFADLFEVGVRTQPDLLCVGAAHSVEAALRKVDELRPDLVVMDYQLEDGDGLTATALITRRYPDIRVVILTAHAHEDLVRGAALAGACCLLPKNGSLPDLLEALRTSRHSGLVVDPALLKSLVSAPVAGETPALSPREDDVLQMLAAGLDVRSIADRLGITPSTCRSYVRTLLTKLDAHSQLQAVATANKLGLLRAFVAS